MSIRYYDTRDNPYRDAILDFLTTYNTATIPSLEGMVNRWMVDEDEHLEGRAAIEYFYEDVTEEVLVSTDDEDRLRGLLLVQRTYPYLVEHAPECDPHYFLSLALVRPEARGNGVFAQLHDTLVTDVCPRAGIPHLGFTTSSENKAIQSFADEYGYDLVYVDENDRGEGVDTLAYVKLDAIDGHVE